MPQPKLPPELRRAQNSINVYKSWTELGPKERRARTHAGRQKFEERFERQVDPDGVLDPVERAKRAAKAREMYFRELALKSAKARARRKAAAEAADESATDAAAEAERDGGAA